jgi:hypothetical protein
MDESDARISRPELAEDSLDFSLRATTLPWVRGVDYMTFLPTTAAWCLAQLASPSPGDHVVVLSRHRQILANPVLIYIRKGLLGAGKVWRLNTIQHALNAPSNGQLDQAACLVHKHPPPSCLSLREDYS